MKSFKIEKTESGYRLHLYFPDGLEVELVKKEFTEDELDEAIDLGKGWIAPRQKENVID